MLFFIVIILPLLTSCVTPKKTSKPPEPEIKEKPAPLPPEIKTFRSDEYVICSLKGFETPESLADKYLGNSKLSWIIEEFNEGTSFNRGEFIVIPLKEKNIGGLTRQGYQVVPILCYHRFKQDCESSLCIPGEVFEKQLRYLKENGYRTISMQELIDFLNYRHAIPKKSFLITIDDGYRSAYDIAYPLLLKYGFTATFFVYIDFVGVSKTAITWDQLRKIKEKGFEVGSHTISHCDLTKKRKGEGEKAYIDRIQKEIQISRHIIDRELQQDTLAIAFPYGKYNYSIINMCDKAGYKLSLSVRNGENPFFLDPLRLKRSQVLKRDLKSFIAQVKTFHELSLED